MGESEIENAIILFNVNKFQSTDEDGDNNFIVVRFQITFNQGCLFL